MTWPTAPLGKLTKMVGGGTPSKRRRDFWTGPIPWVSPKDMSSRELLDTEDHITEAAVDGSNTQVVPEGSVLIVVRSGILVRRFPVAIARLPVALNQDMKALLPTGPLLPEFLAYGLEAHEPVILRQYVKRGATVHSVDIRKLQNMSFPVPAKSEQGRIVEILNRAGAIRRLRMEADSIGKRILPALFRRMFGPPSAWSDHPRTRVLGDLVKIASGATPTKANADLWHGTLPWVSPKDMKRDFISDSADHVSMSAVDETNLKLVPVDSVLVVVRGMILAHSVPVALSLRELTINQDMKALTASVDSVSGAFVWASLRVAESELLKRVKTAGHGTKKLDTADLLQQAIVVPTPNERRAVERAVQWLQESARERARRSHLLERLSATMFHRAFSSELTASWREAHSRDLLQEMEYQAREVGATPTPRAHA